MMDTAYMTLRGKASLFEDNETVCMALSIYKHLKKYKKKNKLRLT